MSSPYLFSPVEDRRIVTDGAPLPAFAGGAIVSAKD
jgi:hypothetical protein